VPNLGEQFQDFTDTAAAIEGLDLVISVDTAIVNLAGAMGKSPWYPTMKLFRQSRPGDWDGVFDCVAAELRKCAGARGVYING
jgi:hypothetical protein